MTSRNDPCPCGSGKKYKHCCVDKPIYYGPCVVCSATSCGAMACKLCDKRYARCHQHQIEAITLMRGHVLRVHPESVPALVDKLITNPKELAFVQAEAERNPELWSRLMQFIAKRHAATKN